MTAKPIVDGLREDGFGIGGVRGTEHRDKELRLADFAGEAVDDGECVPRVIDKQFVAREMGLPQHDLLGPAPAMVVITEGGVLQAVGLRRFVFLP